MNRQHWIALIVAAHLVFPALASAEGWKMPSLSPFAKKDSHPAHLRFADDEEQSAWWKPKMPSLGTSRSGRSSAGPSTWARMSRGTKSAWYKTTDALNPFNDENDKPKAVTGYNTAFTQASSRQKAAKKSSWWSFGAEKKPKRSQTVQDWMGQEMPY